MSSSQEDLTDIYGWTAVACVVGFVTIFFGGSIMKYLLSWWRGVYVPTGMPTRNATNGTYFPFCAPSLLTFSHKMLNRPKAAH
jgi:hypothetical protein